LQVIPGPQTGQNYVVPYLGLTLKLDPAGQFHHGQPRIGDDQAQRRRPPQRISHPVGFWAGRYDVTPGRIRAVMARTPLNLAKVPATKGRYPVESVSWTKAVEFARLVNEREQAAHRVPAGYEIPPPDRGRMGIFSPGRTTTPFSFWRIGQLDQTATSSRHPIRSESENIPSEGVGAGTKPVGSYPPPWGLYDVPRQRQ